MTNQFFEQLILNSPYDYSARHWEMDESGQPTQTITERRRGAQYITPIPKSKKRQSSLALGEGLGVAVLRAFKTTLKAEINEESWATLNSDILRPFPKPKSGRIAVKAINHLGDEVMKVFKV